MDLKKENIQFRILYFIGIVLIVAGHSNGGGLPLLYEWFPPYSFHLGLFMFCSGYFFINKKNINTIDFIKKLIKKFLVPLYIWNLVYGILITILHKYGIKFGSDISLETLFILPIYNGHQFVFNLASWFIWPMVIIQILHIYIIKLLNQNKKTLFYVYFIISLILGFIGVQMAINGYNQKWFLLITRVLYFLPFFSLGILYRNILEKKDNIGNSIYFTILFLISLIIMYIFDGRISYAPSWCNDFDNFYRPFLVGFLGIAFWLRISKILVPVLKNSKIVKTISKNTFSIMMHHLTGFFILNTVWYAILNNILKSPRGFNYNEYISNIFYMYLPKGIYNFSILYLIFGIYFSLKIFNVSFKITNLLKNIYNRITKK